ncbi:MAG: zinc-binding alcohol dehydrogenase family protein [Geminicoccaceae bacterium]
MLAVVCETPGVLKLVERPKPEPAPGEVLIAVRRMGVCGTDLHIFEGTHPFLAYPRVMGHELSGVVVGGNGTKLKAGTEVFIIPYLSCGTCGACAKGLTNCCAKLSVLGVHQDGGMCDYVAVPEAFAVPAEGLSLDEMALVEFLAIGAHAARRASPPPGTKAVVIGAGPIGLASALFLRERGAEVTVVDTRADRLAVANRLCFESTMPAGPDLRDRLLERTDGELCELVLDATGHAAAMEASFGYVAHGGTLVFAGIVKTDLRFSDPELHKREMTVKATRNATPEDFATVVNAIRSRRVPAASLISHRAPLAASVGEFPSWVRPDTGVVKAVVEIGA